MANDVQTPAEPNMTALVSGIVSDAQELFKQQVALFRAEIKADLQRTRRAVSALAVGVGVAAFAPFLLVLALVHLLHWAAPEQLPLWACYAIVGGPDRTASAKFAPGAASAPCAYRIHAPRTFPA